MSSKGKQTFFHPTEMLAIVHGAWIPEKISGVKRRTFIVYNGFLVSVGVIYFILYLLMLPRALKKPELFFRYIGMVFTLIEALVKFTVLRVKKQQIKNVRDALLDEQYNYQSCGSFQPGKMFIDATLFCKRITILLFIAYFSVNVTTITSVLIKLNGFGENNYFPENVTCYDYMPFYFVIPFSTHTVTRCKYAMVCIAVGSYILASYLAAHDTAFISILICIKIKLQILNEAIKSIRERALAKVTLPLHSDSNLEIVDPHLEEILYGEIIHCAKHLDFLLSVSADTDDIFKFITLMQMLEAIIILASCLFVMSLIGQSDPYFFTMALYSAAELTQLLVICYFGNEITAVSSILNSTIYQSDWLNCSKRYKQAIILMMCRMQKELCVSIGNFTPLTLNTFIVVVKGAFSYCAVFQQVNNM